ncbi:uncharacterized protein [Physcomitrium patens]|nr:rootletin-like [Physcomitrium patens]PNR62745.1 hypothetical protein PHYPA_001169 [Physcomitrium patens]|eukprot:XP_024391089.1 rootletin-like [Physcomitrella patens]
MNQVTRSSNLRVAEAEMMTKSLQQENDILRFQLNDLINREKNQRLELQRLRAHRDVEVSALVNASTQQLKGEVERLKGLLEPTSSSLSQALAEKDKIVNEKEQLLAEVERMRKTTEDDENTHGGRVQILETIIAKSQAMTSTILQSVEAFQRHVLPNFKVVNGQINKSSKANDPDGPNKLLDELQKLEAGIALLRVIVDAKNDTLVLIRGKLKQENEELRAELAKATESPSIQHEAAPTQQEASRDHESHVEKDLLRHEIHALQDLYSTKFKQMQAMLKAYQQAETTQQASYNEIRRECQSLQARLATVEASRCQLEENLKDETSARSQLVTNIYHMRKENEALKSELEMVKVNQKFFRGHARKGRLPMDKMDLVNTVNQLLLENSKLRNDNVTLEEDVKTQRRSNVLERVKSVVTARDVALCASNKVGDSELASKLARVRLQQFGGQGSLAQLAFMNGNAGLSPTMSPHLLGETLGFAGWSSPSAEATATTKPTKMGDIYNSGHADIAQHGGLRERGSLSR